MPPPQLGGGTAPEKEVFNVFEPFVGGASGYCESSFQPCGGNIAGTSWVVTDSCTALRGNRRALQREGSELLGLDESACLDAVRRLTARWSGQLEFESTFAVDGRRRTRRFDIDLTEDCFQTTFGVEPSLEVTPALCELLNDDMTSCAPDANGCSCSALTMDWGASSGEYGVIGSRISIQAESQFDTYDYCVQGNRMLFGAPGTNSYLVLRQRDANEVAAPPSPPLEEPH